MAARANKGSDSACAWPAVACSPAGVREIVAAAGTGRKAGQQMVPMSQGERGERELEVLGRRLLPTATRGSSGGRKGQSRMGFWKRAWCRK